jgi:23S rRNA (guanosine2251-2'-O)-methyltransferase
MHTTLIIHNIRSLHNVGSLLRTAECLGVTTVYITGYSPYPKVQNDPRLPYVAERAHKQISKTSLGAEDMLDVRVCPLEQAISELKVAKTTILGLEQTKESVELRRYKRPERLALLIGSERDGMDDNTLALCDQFVEIPMLGNKESLNVVQATAITLYNLNYL